MVRARQVVIAGNGYTGDRLHPGTAGRLLPVLSNIIVTRELTAAERAAVNWQSYLKIWDSRMLLFYYRLLPRNRVLFGARGGIEDTPEATGARRPGWSGASPRCFRRWPRSRPSISGAAGSASRATRTRMSGAIEDGTVHYALAYIGSGVALATYCGGLLAARIAGKAAGEAGPLLGTPLPAFPFPALRRLYQRLAYSYYGLKDEYL